MGIKLNAFELPTDRSWLQLTHPDTGEPLAMGGKPIRIHVLSSDSKEYRRREREVNRKVARAGKKLDLSEYATDRAVAATLEWEPADAFEDEGGRQLDCANVDDVRKLYDAFPRFRDAVLAHSDERSNYRGN